MALMGYDFNLFGDLGGIYSWSAGLSDLRLDNLYLMTLVICKFCLWPWWYMYMNMIFVLFFDGLVNLYITFVR